MKNRFARGHSMPMNRYVWSNLLTILWPKDGDVFSVVMCEDHLKKRPHWHKSDRNDRVFDVRLFPGGETFECERCIVSPRRSPS